MRLYHGSIDRVERPEIRNPFRTLDYDLFHTERSLESLKFIEANEVKI